MIIKIQGVSHNIPTDFKDFKVSRYLRLLRFLENQSAPIKEALEGKRDMTEEEEATFLYNWCAIVADIPNLGSIELFWLSEIYNATNFILSMPENAPIIMELNGVEATKSLTTVGGAVLLGGGMSYEQFMLLEKLKQMMKAENVSGNIEILKQMLIVLYPVPNESKEDQRKRLESFNDLNILELYSAWFFFVKSLNGWANYFQYLTKNQTNKEVKAVKSILKAKFCESLKGLTGIAYWHTNWLKHNVLGR